MSFNTCIHNVNVLLWQVAVGLIYRCRQVNLERKFSTIYNSHFPITVLQSYWKPHFVEFQNGQSAFVWVKEGEFHLICTKEDIYQFMVFIFCLVFGWSNPEVMAVSISCFPKAIWKVCFVFPSSFAQMFKSSLEKGNTWIFYRKSTHNPPLIQWLENTTVVKISQNSRCPNTPVTT